MKLSLLACFIAAGWLVGSLLALANPAMLPKHPGYPMGKAVDPVNGQLLANDAGQKNVTVQEALVDSARVNESHSKQNLLMNEENRRIIEKPGAGLLPKVEGPHIKIEPPVKEGTRVTASPQ